MVELSILSEEGFKKHTQKIKTGSKSIFLVIRKITSLKKKIQSVLNRNKKVNSDASVSKKENSVSIVKFEKERLISSCSILEINQSKVEGSKQTEVKFLKTVLEKEIFVKEIQIKKMSAINEKRETDENEEKEESSIQIEKILKTVHTTMTEITLQNQKTINNLCATIANQLKIPQNSNSLMETKRQQMHNGRDCIESKTFYQGQNFLQSPPLKTYYQQDNYTPQGTCERNQRSYRKEKAKKEIDKQSRQNAIQPQFSEVRYCELCKTKTHNTNACIKGNTPLGACYKCKQQGHFARQCFNSQTLYCYFCNKLTHNTSDCRSAIPRKSKCLENNQHGYCNTECQNCEQQFTLRQDQVFSQEISTQSIYLQQDNQGSQED